MDDWALRKGRTYGSILVDLEACRVVDLLPDRSAPTLEAWLRRHPGVKVLTRDRSTEYARAAAAGAPKARLSPPAWFGATFTEITEGHRSTLPPTRK